MKRTCFRPEIVLALFLGLTASFAGSPAAAQELNCAVSVDISNLEGSEFDFLNELEERIREYVNEETWTDDRFQPFERIDCGIDIYFQEATSLTDFQAQLVVSSRRPIYNTMQQSPVVQFKESNWQFSYAKGEPLSHNLERYDPLTSVLDFYAYILLGYDYDTFSEMGGTPYFEQARRIANRARSAGASGWSQAGQSRGRGVLISQLMDARFRPLRMAYFNYHLGGLDLFVTETQKAREQIIGVLESLQELYEAVSRSYVIDIFFSSKYRELAAIFEGASVSSRAYSLLTELDPAHEYEEIEN